MGGGGRRTCWKYANGQKIYVYEKNVFSGLFAPAPGLFFIYMCMTIIFKHQTLCGASLVKGNESKYTLPVKK